VEDQVSRDAVPRPGLRERARGLLRWRYVLPALAVLVAVVAVVWALGGSGDGSSPATSGPVAAPIAPVALNESALRTLAVKVPQQIYWAGPRAGYLYELKRNPDGSVYIRYLPANVKAGTPGAKYLTIATYPFPGAYDALKATRGRHVSLPRNGIALIAPNYRKSIHLAYPDTDYQVEVFDPSPAEVLQLVSSGRIRPVG